jgi:hypothetical protein
MSIIVKEPHCSAVARLGSSADLLIRSYLHRVQRRPDQSVTWHDRQPLVRTRPPAAGSRSPGWLPGWLPPTRERKAGSATIMGMCGEW